MAWQASEKVSAYVFAGNDYQPGYGGGGARMVYRAGYGADWKFAARWALGGSVLHDYQDSLDSGNTSPLTGEVRHFFNAHCGYSITKKLLLSFAGNYINDEYEVDQAVVTLSLDYKY